ncbi:hypothetical protein Glove_368g39 [Diversispora epigaea]|uniref:Uncharacterized protein n=1 Tax=Diversispora epigaea TaxID=1348612 RepID=A0A397H6U2_9GLOM|nr:hypothetical protein Glove_368g39 [Diversispora epigaea]
MPKTLRDMYTDLIKAVNYDDQKANKLQVFGILHLGCISNLQDYGALIMIKNNLQILNILNDGDYTESDNLLNELLEDEQYSTPPPT